MRRNVLVALFDQQPFLLGLLQLDERPAAAKLVAPQLEQQLALFESFAHVLEGGPHATIPDDDRTCAIVPFWNDSLEVAVLEGVVFDFYGEALVGRVGGRPLGDRPRFEDPVHLQPQVPMQARRVVHVDDEQPTRFGRRLGD